ncbi:YqhA family protein [Pseudoroseomonas cervicalis]|uniref:YqhA family protein n=1 Tax=Teichococcus cervicalis TaxID=204525 RepID=UPI002786A5D9|nr:YqhA family protein [Pseudoroseomonas cervicalis]MDQ1080624.1 putative membrane protein YqhA [Pseudoroseomonas cervicalis]
MISRILAASRFIMVLPFAMTLLCSVVLILCQCVAMLSLLAELLLHPELSPRMVKLLAVRVIEAVDVFLIGIALYIIGIGLYTLFVDDRIRIPAWLRLAGLEDLKSNLVGVVIAVLAVMFLGEAVAWEGGTDIAAFGASCALVIAALSFFLTRNRHRDP